MGNPSAAPRASAKRSVRALSGLLVAFGVSSIVVSAQAADVANVDDARIIENAKTGKEWLSNGLDYSVNRFSPLDQINAANVGKLGLGWSYDLNSIRGVEATPIVVDGIMYVTAPWAIVYAINAKTGEKIWTFDSQSPRNEGYQLCCDVVNRGVAVYKGKVYVGTPDARLIALDAATGKVLWSIDASPDRARPYTLTAAPLVAKGKVLVGGGGGEYGVRGVISAFDAETGKLAWRWYTVPGDPAKPFENDAMAKAARDLGPEVPLLGERRRRNGLEHDLDRPGPEPLVFRHRQCGTLGVLDPQSVRPETISTRPRSSRLDLDTGKYAWHYQGTPADAWDYDADQDPILTDLTIDGQKREVLLHAGKNGFFYVLDRKTGQFISAKNFVDVNWATGYAADGRAIEIPGARGTDKPIEAIPGPFGAHNWQSMSFSPKTGFAYIPAQNVPFMMIDDPKWTQGSGTVGQPMNGIGWNLGKNLVTTRRKASLSAGSSPGTRFIRRRPGRRITHRRGTAGRLRPPEASSSRVRRMGGSSPTTRRAARSCGTPRSAAASSRRR